MYEQLHSEHKPPIIMNIYHLQRHCLLEMEWFNGGVREAIAAAQAKKTVFVVVVTGW